MTTLLHKMNAHEKAWAISSGFGELLIKALIPTPRQGLASKRTSFRSVMKYHMNDSSTPVCDITSVRAAKCDKSKRLWLANRWRAE